MNSTQYKNIIDYTVSHNDTTNASESLETVRAVFKNMGVPLPHGTCKEVYEILKTDDYMGWHSCTIKDARDHANAGTPAIGISEDRVVVISPEDTEETSGIASTAAVMSVATRTVQSESSIMTLSDSTPALAVTDLEFYAYSMARTGGNNSTNYSIVGGDFTTIIGAISTKRLTPTTTTTIRWYSSNSNVASINRDSGRVTANAVGTTTITAKNNNGTVLASCQMRVVKDIVTIEKAGDYFNVNFYSGEVWKSIGEDMSKADYFTPQEQWDRTNWNLENLYSVDQLAILYLFDPLGIEYYMKNYYRVNSDMEDWEILYFKDSVYEAIFGVRPRYFREGPGYIQYYESDEMGINLRKTVYSDAEIIFGAHSISDGLSIANVIIDVTTDLFTHIPVISEVTLGMEICKALFFSSAATGAMSSIASTFVENYISNSLTQRFKKMPKWCNNLIIAAGSAVITGIGSAINSFTIPNLSDITIYNHINSENFATNFVINGTELSLEEIINHCEY